MMRICKECGGVEFNILLQTKATAQIIDDGLQMTGQGDAEVVSNLQCTGCGHEVEELSELAEADQCTVCGEWAVIGDMVRMEEGEHTGRLVCGDCIKPALEDMDKDELLEVVKSKDGEMEDLKAQMLEMQKQMQAFMANATAPLVGATITAEPIVLANHTVEELAEEIAPAIVEEKVIETNIPTPEELAAPVELQETPTPGLVESFEAVTTEAPYSNPISIEDININEQLPDFSANILGQEAPF